MRVAAVLLTALVLICSAGALYIYQKEKTQQQIKKEQIEKEKQEAEEKARAEADLEENQKETEKKRQQEAYLKKAQEAREQAAREAEEKAQAEAGMKKIEELLAEIYDADTDTVAMNTSRNSQIFQDAQNEMWKLPETYEDKLAQYQKIIDRISVEWDFLNDEFHYETSTLKVSVEEKDAGYTRYWVCHVETFSTRQLCSALCGGTYGNPRRTVSQELADHNGVIGVNGSGFSYGSGIPAPGKTMIKDGKIYNDVYSNGNIFCVTQDGGMFTAAAGMTTEDMLNRGVKDTYCFGPTLVENGKAVEISGQFRQTSRYQRTAVGMVSPGDYYLVAVDGKGAGGSQGMTYQELQQVFVDLGCDYAYHLDGGGSTTLVFKGRVLNMLTDNGKERPCGDILYFIDVGDGGEGDSIVVHEDEAMIRPPDEEGSTTLQ